jgi:carbon monoxide dehydrogenase subunit G
VPLGSPFSGATLPEGSSASNAAAPDGPALELDPAPKELSREESSRLFTGGSVERRFELTLNARPYLAALSYSGVSRPKAEVFRIMSTPEELPKALPVTRDTKFVNNNSQMYVVQGTFLIHGSYTLHWVVDEATGLVRFWLDPKLPHDITDVVGFFRVEEQAPGRSLLTVAVAVDIGDSPVAGMFKGKIHDYLSRPARYVARYIQRHAPAAAK